ncbi:MarR family transcriptional regulator [Microbacterium sp. JZ37]|uniref:MarR family winged helix-turn-helix transcriptional regulator n=1 Tax=Microbacterium sp. JZ37 TaxID=2654193 RepID=UPI002B47E569|nr:MarR family transcriptional regulator [Microbacterium sp. JZ37]WRH17768.1 MarR family transcriptional regulator [Microbacterium sp. JZ37]
MDRARDLESIIVAAHALTRVAALETRNEAPAAQWRTLAILRERGPLRIGELARLSRITQPGVTRLIGGMADAGLVAREPDPDDSRAVRVAATERGEQAYAAWRVQLVEALLPRFADLSDSEWQALRTSAELLTQRMADARPADGEESSAR